MKASSSEGVTRAFFTPPEVRFVNQSRAQRNEEVYTLPGFWESLYADEPFLRVGAQLSDPSPSSESSMVIFRFVRTCYENQSVIGICMDINPTHRFKVAAGQVLIRGHVYVDRITGWRRFIDAPSTVRRFRKCSTPDCRRVGSKIGSLFCRRRFED